MQTVGRTERLQKNLILRKIMSIFSSVTLVTKKSIQITPKIDDGTIEFTVSFTAQYLVITCTYICNIETFPRIISNELCASRLARVHATHTRDTAIKTYLLHGIFPFYFYRGTLVSFTRANKSAATTWLRARKIGRVRSCRRAVLPNDNEIKILHRSVDSLPRFSNIRQQRERERERENFEKYRDHARRARGDRLGG